METWLRFLSRVVWLCFIIVQNVYALDLQTRIKTSHVSRLPQQGADQSFDKKNLLSFRSRLGVDFQTSILHLRLQPQLAGFFESYRSTQSVDEVTFDFHELSLTAELHRNFSIRAGRHEIRWGRQRIIGNDPWLQRGRSFDQLHLQWLSGFHQYSFYGIHIRNDDRLLIDEFPQGQDLIALHARWHFLRPQELEAYVLSSRGISLISPHLWTMGIRVEGWTNLRTDWITEAEMTGQLRQSRQLNVADQWEAQMILRLGRHLRKIRQPLSLEQELNWASDQFHPLYSSGSLQLGESTFFGRRNLWHTSTSLLWKLLQDPSEKGWQHPDIRFSLHHYFQLQGEDPLLLASHATSFFPEGLPSADGGYLGSEANLSATWNWQHWIFTFAWSGFSPSGRFSQPSLAHTLWATLDWQWKP